MRQTLSKTSLICMHWSIVESTGNPITPDVHSEGGRATEAFGGGGARRQDRPESDRRGAELHLRGRVPRVQLWLAAEARTARCAGRSSGRDHRQEGELHS